MLAAYIIRRILDEENEKRKHSYRPQTQLPVVDIPEIIIDEEPEEVQERGVIIIEMWSQYDPN